MAKEKGKKEKYKNLKGKDFLITYFKDRGVTDEELRLCYLWDYFYNTDNLEPDDYGLDYAERQCKKIIEYRNTTLDELKQDWRKQPWAWPTAMEYAKVCGKVCREWVEGPGIHWCDYKGKAYVYGTGKGEVPVTEDMLKNGTWYVYTFSD